MPADRAADTNLRELPLELRLRGDGALPAWIGALLRGIAALRFKDTVCRLDSAERARQGAHCKGCRELPACPYGRNLEPDARLLEGAAFGQQDAFRPLVLRPAFPAPLTVRSGQTLRASLLFFGAAWQDREGILDALRGVGAKPDPGRDHVRFEVHEGESSIERLDPAGLPRSIGAREPVVPYLELRLLGPLFLRRRDASGRRAMDLDPSFGELFRSAMREVSHALRCAGAPVEADWQGLKDLALRVERDEASFRVLDQGHFSSRHEKQWRLRGITGVARFRSVPHALLPWMYWGGRLGIGSHRVAGAGAWELRVLGDGSDR